MSETPKYPGIPTACDGSDAVVHAETNASEAAGAYPITPSTQMGEGWALAVAKGKTNAFGRRLIFFEPEGEHAAAGVTAGMSMTGLRSTNFSSGQGIAYMHESLYAAAGKRLPYVLNVAARAMTKHALNVHAGHDDYHAVDDAGFFQLFSKNVQEAADLTVISHRIAELSLTPGMSAQDGFLTSHVIEDVLLPEPELIREYLGDPADEIDSPTPAQRLVFGPTRRRVPELFNLDYPAMLGTVQNQDAYAQGVAAQRPFYFDHVRELADRAFSEYAALTGRTYAPVQGYRLDDAEYVIVGMGTIVPNAEAAADHLRAEGIKVGVMNVTMFRPFPSDLVAEMLAGKKGVTVMERLDQPLAADPPLLREIRSAMAQAVENGRAAAPAAKRGGLFGRDSGNGNGVRPLPFPHLPRLSADQVPDFYACGFGFGSRDIQPGDLIATVDNMVDESKRRRHFYLGVEFIRKNTRIPKLQLFQDQLTEAYPDIGERALAPADPVNLLPKNAVSLRIHSVGGWGAITMGKNVALTAFELFGMHVKANPKYGSEKKGQPTTFYTVLAHEPVRPNAELKYVNIVLSPDGNVFKHSNPLAGLAKGGVFVIQSDRPAAEVWGSFPEYIQRDIQERDIEVYALDGFGIASSEASEADLRYRMQGTAFMGAFFRTSGLAEREGMGEEELFEGLLAQLRAKFGSKGDQVVQDNLRVIRRGYDEVQKVLPSAGAGAAEEAAAGPARIPSQMDIPAEHGIADPSRFFDQVCSVCAVETDGIADPFIAISAIPAATSAVRDMTNIRFEVPEFVADKCTGCSQCWVQCPDAAIPGLVVPVEDLLDRAIAFSANGTPKDRVKQISRHLAKECRKALDAAPFKTFAQVAASAYANVADKLGWDPERRRQLDDEWAGVYSVLADFPLAKTVPFYDVPERKEKGSGGLLAVTINPEACKGCNICVEVCPEEALVTVRQTDEVVDELRENWKFWEALPDTDDRYVNVSDIDEGIGVLSSLLLKKENYRSMAGGDGACMGCGEKTAVHLVVSTIEAVMQPRVERFVTKLDRLILELDGKVREAVAAHADTESLDDGHTEIELPEDVRRQVDALNRTRKGLQDLRWRYETGPSGRGRAPVGITNSTGCSSVWGSTYPFNPYPFPWVNHLFQDAPSIAVGVFEGHMRKMVDGFIQVRRAEKLLDGSYDATEDELAFATMDWRDLDDEEFKLCPPILTIGGDGAMLDIGFQNLSRLMASGKPIRVMVLDTQVYSNTGGQACTSGFTGQIADMSAWGTAQKGKEEVRKELGYIALAHRGVYVHQSSQALASHLMEGVIKGLNSRRPAIFNIYTPCPVEHGLPDEWAPEAAKLALESRAFPFMTYDPDAGDDIADCLSLEGNPDIDATWPTYTLTWVDDEGAEHSEDFPLSTADWAFTEGRFRKHFKRLPKAAWDDEKQVPFADFVFMSPEEREGRRPFIWTLDGERRRDRVEVSNELVFLAEERLNFWHQLRELAGLDVPDEVRDRMEDEAERAFAAKLEALRAEYEQKLADLRQDLPAAVARRMAKGLLAHGGGDKTVADILASALQTPLEPLTLDKAGGIDLGGGNGAGGNGAPGGGGNGAAGAAGTGTSAGNGAPAATAAPPEPTAQASTAAPPAPAAEPPPAPAEDDDDSLALEPWIETSLCTSCNECTNINGQMFAYDQNKQAYIKDPRAGTFAQIVQAAEKCPAAIIHPGDPLNPKEKDLEKWIKRAQPFN